MMSDREGSLSIIPVDSELPGAVIQNGVAKPLNESTTIPSAPAAPAGGAGQAAGGSGQAAGGSGVEESSRVQYGTEFHGKTLFRISNATQNSNGDWSRDTRFPSAQFEMMPARSSVYSGKGQDVPGANASGFREVIETALVRLNVPNQRPIYQDLGILENCLYIVGGFVGFDNGNIRLDTGATRSHNAWAEYMDVKEVIRQGRPVMLEMAFWNGFTLTHDSGKNYRGMVEKFEVVYATAHRIFYTIKIQLTNRESLFLTHGQSKLLEKITPPAEPGISSLGRQNLIRMQAAVAQQLQDRINSNKQKEENQSSPPSPEPQASPSPLASPEPTPSPTPMATPKPPETKPVPTPAVPKPVPSATPTPTPAPSTAPSLQPTRAPSRPVPSAPAVPPKTNAPVQPPRQNVNATESAGTTLASQRYTASAQQIERMLNGPEDAITGIVGGYVSIGVSQPASISSEGLKAAIAVLSNAETRGLPSVMTPEFRKQFQITKSAYQAELGRRAPSRDSGRRPTR